MRVSFTLKLFVLGTLTLMAVSVVSAFAAGINVQPSNVGNEARAVTAEDVKPDACSALHLTNIISGSGTLTGTAGNDLIIGSSSADTIDGMGGDDCIIGGGGDDMITGGDGNDVCIGGAGTNTFDTCESEIQ